MTKFSLLIVFVVAFSWSSWAADAAKELDAAAPTAFEGVQVSRVVGPLQGPAEGVERLVGVLVGETVEHDLGMSAALRHDAGEPNDVRPAIRLLEERG